MSASFPVIITLFLVYGIHSFNIQYLFKIAIETVVRSSVHRRTATEQTGERTAKYQLKISPLFRITYSLAVSWRLCVVSCVCRHTRDANESTMCFSTLASNGSPSVCRIGLNNWNNAWELSEPNGRMFLCENIPMCTLVLINWFLWILYIHKNQILTCAKLRICI